MCENASSRTSKWSLNLTLIVLIILQVTCGHINNAAPQPHPIPMEEVEEETRRTARLHPHRITFPTFPDSADVQQDDSEEKYNLTSGQMENNLDNKEQAQVPQYIPLLFDGVDSQQNLRANKRAKRQLSKLKNVLDENKVRDFSMLNPYDMGGRPPPGKTERRKKKTFDMAHEFIIRNKRAVTLNMKDADELGKKIERIRREIDPETGHEENLRKRNKKEDPKRNIFKAWMSEVVPEHAHHLEKLPEHEVDKLMKQKVHGMEKTYGDLFHEHQQHLKGEQLHREGGHSAQREGLHAKNHIINHEENLKREQEIELKKDHEKNPRKSLMEEHYLREKKEHEIEAEHKKEHEIEGKHEHEIEAKHAHEHEIEAQHEHELELEKEEEHQKAQAPTQPPQPPPQQPQFQQQMFQQQQMYNQQNQQYGGNYGNYGGMQGGMGGMQGGMGMGMNGMGMQGGMGMNGMGMGMNGMGMGMGQMGGVGAIINAIGNNLPKMSQTQAQAQGPQGQQQNYNQNYPQGSPNGQNPAYPNGPDPNAPDPNVQNAQQAAAAQEKTAQDQEAQMQQPDGQDSVTALDQQDQDPSFDEDSAVKPAATDVSDDDVKAANSNDGIQPDDLQLPSGQLGDNGQIDNAQLGQMGQFDNAESNNLAAAAGGV